MVAILNHLNFHTFFLIFFFKLNFWDLIYHLLKQTKNGMIIYPQNNELRGDNMVTKIDVQLNCYINTMAVMREHEFEMMAIWCAFFPWL